ncbi:hypothetical protein EMIT0P44_100001 [Pseudomonas sp. IT-P44]
MRLYVVTSSAEPVGAGLLAMAVYQAPFLRVYISIPAVTAANGFALTASPFFKRQKGTKRLCP